MRTRSSGSDRNESSVLKRASRPAPRISPTTAVPMAMISSMLMPCDTGLSRDEIATNVREQTKTPLGLRKAAKIGFGLRRRHRRGELHVVDTEAVQRSGDGQLLFDREMGERELFALTERAVDDAKRGDAHELPYVVVDKKKEPLRGRGSSRNLIRC